MAQVQIDKNMVIDTEDRNWWWILRFIGVKSRGNLVRRLFLDGAITEYQLWDVLSTHNSPVPYGVATYIYRELGYKPHSGYPLQKSTARPG